MFSASTPRVRGPGGRPLIKGGWKALPEEETLLSLELRAPSAIEKLRRRPGIFISC